MPLGTTSKEQPRPQKTRLLALTEKACISLSMVQHADPFRSVFLMPESEVSVRSHGKAQFLERRGYVSRFHRVGRLVSIGPCRASPVVCEETHEHQLGSALSVSPDFWGPTRPVARLQHLPLNWEYIEACYVWVCFGGQERAPPRRRFFPLYTTCQMIRCTPERNRVSSIVFAHQCSLDHEPSVRGSVSWRAPAWPIVTLYTRNENTSISPTMYIPCDHLMTALNP